MGETTKTIPASAALILALQGSYAQIPAACMAEPTARAAEERQKAILRQ